MNLEEYLTCYDLMRSNRDQLLAQVDELEQASRNKDNTIGALEEELRQLELLAAEGKIDVGSQTIIGAAYFNKKPDPVGSSRGSGSLGSQGRGGRGGGGGRGVGGGGRIAGKPPAGDARKGSRMDDTQGSKQGLQIDTTSSRDQPSGIGGTANQSPTGSQAKK